MEPRDEEGAVICLVSLYTVCLNAQRSEVGGIKICLDFPGPAEKLYLCEYTLVSDIFRNNTNYTSNKCYQILHFCSQKACYCVLPMNYFVLFISVAFRGRDADLWQ